MHVVGYRVKYLSVGAYSAEMRKGLAGTLSVLSCLVVYCPLTASGLFYLAVLTHSGVVGRPWDSSEAEERGRRAKCGRLCVGQQPGGRLTDVVVTRQHHSVGSVWICRGGLDGLGMADGAMRVISGRQAGRQRECSAVVPR